ncbi:MAG: biotin transporter BioY [Oscillospiraceae bacterium]|nr:biotin transporter BioY [Oscillospiraceae bacterium]
MKKTQMLTLTGLCCALLCIAAPVTLPIPISPVPISLAPLALFISSYILTPLQCFAGTVIYIMLGAVGLPVFSGFTGGVGIIAGPTGGFLLGYMGTALISSFFVHRYEKKYLHIMGMIVGMCISYFMGAVWFAFQQNVTFLTALTLCVIPYIAGDMIKIFIAVFIGEKLQKTVKKIH